MNGRSPGKPVEGELRDVQLSESPGFTPRLARGNKLAILAGSIGFALEREAQGKAVDLFRVDIFYGELGASTSELFNAVC